MKTSSTLSASVSFVAFTTSTGKVIGSCVVVVVDLRVVVICFSVVWSSVVMACFVLVVSVVNSFLVDMFIVVFGSSVVVGSTVLVNSSAGASVEGP